MTDGPVQGHDFIDPEGPGHSDASPLLATAGPVVMLRREGVAEWLLIVIGLLVFGCASQVAVGSVDLRPLFRILQRPWHRAYQWARNSPILMPLVRTTPAKSLFAGIPASFSARVQGT